MNLSDRAKVALSLVGAVLLIALCIKMMRDPNATEGAQIFAAAFLVLIVYAASRFFKKKK